MRKDPTFVVMACYTSAAIALVIILAAWSFTPRDPYPQSTDDCPPGHVYIDYGETPQAGCWPEGVAREMGVWPQP